MKYIVAFILFSLTLYGSTDYNTRNLLSSVTDDKGTTNYAYDALGRQSTATYPNGVVTTNTYNVKSQITNIEHKDSHGVVIQSFAYTLDNVGNKIKVVENTNRTTSYEYNNVNQLIKEIVTNDPNNNNTTTTFEYDLVGNLITKTINGVETHYVYNDNDQLISEGTSTFAYDANGNLITKDNISYSYDAQDRLVKVQTPTDTTTYTYDANNNRIAQTINNQTTSYLVDTNTPYANVITQSKGGVKTSYTYGNDLLNDNEHYFLTDALGSTRALSDVSGTITDTYSYTPYGELSNHTGSSQNNFLFAGEQFDSQIGEYYLRARYYDPSQARFISRDTYDGTLTNPITQNHYAYAGSNPAMYVDPSGHFFGGFATFSLNMMSTIMSGYPRIAGTVEQGTVASLNARTLVLGIQMRNEAINSIVLAMMSDEFSKQDMEYAYDKYNYATKYIGMTGGIAENTMDAIQWTQASTGFAKGVLNLPMAKYSTIPVKYEARVNSIDYAKVIEWHKITKDPKTFNETMDIVKDSLELLNKIMEETIK